MVVTILLSFSLSVFGADVADGTQLNLLDKLVRSPTLKQLQRDYLEQTISSKEAVKSQD